ncbi:MAG: activator of HSP90 ATPase [Oceanicaulis sp.]|nr:activator of HSP90 ATPase [Oceanicaulis sp.]MBI75584.1 activator of HSP90 ATPase [Oceanicaulis sp.]|tara:strand:- start:122 stop:556 length:435 start_codon:yes stop_codon:yes gene_type:complete
MAEPRIEKSLFLKAPRERVWDFLTGQDNLARWFHPVDRSLDRPGPYMFLKSLDEPERCMWGEVVEAEAPARLVYTFTHKWLGEHETRVEWTLSEVASGTLVKLVHDGFEGAPVDVFEQLCGHDAGWDEHFVKLRVRVIEPAMAG